MQFRQGQNDCFAPLLLRSHRFATGALPLAFRLASNALSAFSSLCPTQKHQNRPNGRFVVFGRGRTIVSLRSSFALIASRPARFRSPFVWRRTLCPRSHHSALLKNTKTAQTGGLSFLAGAERFERSTLGFGDQCSTN